MDYNITITLDNPEVDFRIIFYELQSEISDDNFVVINNTTFKWDEEEGDWYNLIRDMTLLSNLFKLTLFTVDVRCQEWEGTLRYYFKDGKYYTVEPKIIYPEFDEDKLKEFEFN